MACVKAFFCVFLSGLLDVAFFASPETPGRRYVNIAFTKRPTLLTYGALLQKKHKRLIIKK